MTLRDDMASQDGDARADGAALRIMLVDDSAVARAILEQIIDRQPGLEVVASVATAAQALQHLPALSVDIIILDLEMPGMCGITALPLLLQHGRGARVIILSANCADGGPAALEAMALGAADTLLKPGRGGFAGSFSKTLLARLHALGGTVAEAEGAPRQSKVRNPVDQARRKADVARDFAAIDAIGIGASTGGIVAIHAFLAGLPPALAAPIFITQHLPASFIPFFAEQLTRALAREVVTAVDGVTVRPGKIYIAPGDGHLCLSRKGNDVVIAIDSAPAPSRIMPAVDPMMASIAAVYGDRGCAVMLSGMGRDGLIGTHAVHDAGGAVLAQDVGSSVVWGMPGSVVKDGIAHHVLSPAALATLWHVDSGRVAR